MRNDFYVWGAVEVAGYVPKILFGGYPLERVVAQERKETREADHNFVSFRRCVFMKVREREFSYCFVDWLAEAQRSMVGFTDRAPVIFVGEERDDMVVVFIVCLEVQDERPLSMHEKRMQRRVHPPCNGPSSLSVLSR